MKIFKNKIVKCIIVIPVIMMLLLSVVAPTKVYARKSQEGLLWNIGEKFVGGLKSVVGLDTSLAGDMSWDFAPGNLIKEIMYMLVGIGDVLISLLQVVLVGDYDFWMSTMITNVNDNLDNTDSWLYAGQDDVDSLEEGNPTPRGSTLVYASDAGLDAKWLLGDWSWEVPNIIYCPENIFSNKIAALDANFINPNRYNVITDTSIFGIQTDEGEKEAISFASAISPTIATWYRAFRNLAIVALLTVLVYIGIRIVIGSTAGEKAKYKERIQDWFVALCLVFFMHYIMAAIMMFVEMIVDLFDQSINSGIIVSVDDGTIFRTNFTGYIRFAAQSASWKESLGYGIMYIMVIGIIIRYTWQYLKRFFYLAFFTMIAPLIAVTYPLDKMADGKAQAYNKWFKEYLINAMLQPMHLVLYTSLISSAITLCVQNPIYAIAVMIFISTAEKWVKDLFKMNEAKLTSNSIGDIAMLGAIASVGKKFVGGAVSTVTNIAKFGAAAAATVATGGAAAPAAGAALGAGAAGAGAAGVGAVGAAGAASGTAGLLGGLTEAGTAVSTATSVIDGVSTVANVAGDVGGTVMDAGSSIIDAGGTLFEAANQDLGGDFISESSGDGVESSMNRPDITSRLIGADDNQDSQNGDMSDNDEPNDNNRVGAGTSSGGPGSNTGPGRSDEELARLIGQSVAAGVKSAHTQMDKEKEQKEKDKKARQDFIDAGMEDSMKTKAVQGMVKGVGAMGGALAGAVGGLFVGAIRGEDYGKTATLGAMKFAEGVSKFNSEVLESGLDVFRDIKRKHLEAMAGVSSAEELQDESKAKMMRKVASMGARNNWSEDRTVFTYTAASSPQFQNMATDEAAVRRFEQYMRRNGSATQEQIEQAKKDIIEAQKPSRRISGRR